MKRGYWISDGRGRFYCSVCLVTAPYKEINDHIIYMEVPNYCPFCGAKMKKRNYAPCPRRY